MSGGLALFVSGDPDAFRNDPHASEGETKSVYAGDKRAQASGKPRSESVVRRTIFSPSF